MLPTADGSPDSAHFLTSHPPFTFYNLKHWKAVPFFQGHRPILPFYHVHEATPKHNSIWKNDLYRL